MKKITFIFALLCASVMGWSYDIAPSTTFGGHYQWQEIDGVTPPANVVNVQSHGGFDCLYITFADAGFNRDNIVGGDVFTDEGAQAWLKLASCTDASTDVYFYKTGSTTEIRWGLRILNTEAGSGSSFDPASIDWNNVDYITGQSQYKIYFTEENRPSNWETINIQTAPWAGNNTGIYVTTPDGVSACSLGDKVGCWIEGAQVLMYLTAFDDEVTEVTITHASGTKTLYVYNANAGSGSSTPEPDPNEYTAGGHTIHLDAYYVDIDGTNKSYTLVITSTDNMEGLGGSFWYVSGASTDMRSNSGTNSYSVSGDKKTITCSVVSNANPSIHTPLYVLMPGEVNFGDVTLNWEDRTPITSEYCNYQGSETQQDGHYYAITWETDPSGNVVITIGNGTGAGASSYRNGGFEGDNNGLARFVVSDDDFATTTPASDYFTVTRPSDGDLEYVLTKIADLPANAKIKHLSAGAIAWREAGVDRWCFPEFTYTYGGTCNQLDAPTNVAIDANNIITFDAVAGADSYMAYVSLGGVEKYSQAVASGDELTFTALVTGDYIINVVASGAGKVDSDPSADVVWHLEAAPVVLGNSEYCEHVFMADDNREAAFTWETDGDGNIVITISATRGDAAATHFRGNGMALANFKVGAGKADASTYFNHACGGSNQVTLSLKNPANAPALGEKIYFNNTVEYATSLDGNAWPTLNFEWTYGTVCSGKSVSASVNNNTMGSAVVQKAGVDVTNVDEGDEVSFIATSADPALYRFVNWTKGGVEVSTSATYVTTITETTNLVANFDYVRDTYCHYELLSNESAVQGKKLYMTVGAIGGGDYRIMFEGSAEAPFTGLQDANFVINQVTAKTDVDGQPKTGQDVPFTKANGRWNFSADGYGKAWIEFSLAEGKTIDDIYVWANAVFFNTASGVLGYVDNNDRLGLFGMNANKRHNIDWDATCSDAEAPVFDKAEAEVLNETSVQLKIQATDNWGGLLTYTIAREAAEPIISNHASGEEFTQDVTGLTAGTEYTFTVTVSDGVNNTNQNIVVTPVGDVTKPVMVEASLASKTYKSAIINVAATDDKGVTAYYIVENDADYVASEGKITVEGLTAATPYTYTIKAKDAAGNISDNAAEVNFTTDAHELVPTTAAPVPTWPAEQVKSIYSDAYALATVGTPNYNAPWWNAPAINLLDISGDHFMDYDLANDGMIGWQYNQISVVSMEKVHIDIYASAAGTVTIRPITDGDGALNDNRKTLTLAAQEWNSFDVDLAEFGAHDWSKLFQFAIEYWNAGGLTGEHISVDNVYFYRTTPPPADVAAPTDVTVNSTVAKFTSVTIKAQANDDSGVVHFKVLNGSDVLVADVEAVSGAEATIVVNGLAHSTAYNLNLIAYDEASHEAEPVAVAFSTNNAPAAAPVPTHDAKYVLSVYSNAYEPAVAASFNRSNWGSAPLALEEDYLLYSMSANVVVWGNNDGNAGHGNIDGLSGYTHGTTPGLDVSNMQYIHFDVWCDADEQLNTVNINDQAIAIPTTRTVAGQWVSFDVAISGVALADRQNLRWLKFHPFNAANCNAAIDNVYFWSYGVTPNAAQGTDAGGWATFAAPIKLAVPAGLTAYKASYQKTETEEILNLTPIDVIPANAGVILKGTASEDYILTPTDAEASDVSDNVLVGCVTRTDVSAVRATKDIFCMRYSGSYDFTGFFLYEGQYVPAGKAYLALPKLSQPSSAPRKVRFVIKNEQTVTDIELTGADTVEATKFIENGQMFIRRGEAVYNLQGVRVK